MIDVIYYARPFTFAINPLEKYRTESSTLHEYTEALIISTIPLTDYHEISWNNVLEKRLFKLAEEMIKQSDLLVYQGDSKGVRKEIALAKKYGVRVVEYYQLIKYYTELEEVMDEV
jgi:hypothetical protein